jgi:hypothetical protein
MRPSLCGTEDIDGLSRVLAQKHAKTTPLGQLSEIIGDAPPVDPVQPGARTKKLNPLR